MNEVELLKGWMQEHGYSIQKLADATEMSYDGLYAFLVVRQRIPGSFKWRFTQRFGLEAANSIFDLSPAPAPALPNPAPA